MNPPLHWLREVAVAVAVPLGNRDGLFLCPEAEEGVLTFWGGWGYIV